MICSSRSFRRSVSATMMLRCFCSSSLDRPTCSSFSCSMECRSCSKSASLSSYLHSRHQHQHQHQHQCSNSGNRRLDSCPLIEGAGEGGGVPRELGGLACCTNNAMHTNAAHVIHRLPSYWARIWDCCAATALRKAGVCCRNSIFSWPGSEPQKTLFRLPMQQTAITNSPRL
jgi:hypothetical protein